MHICRPRRYAPRARVCFDSCAGASLSRRRAQPEDGTPLPILFRPARALTNSAHAHFKHYMSRQSCTNSGGGNIKHSQPREGRNSIGRRSSVHAVHAQPLQTIKNNIEPDEHREEADTIPTRGVNPESLPAPGLRPALCTSVGLVATLLGLGYVLIHVQGLTPLPILFRPHAGAIKFGVHSKPCFLYQETRF